MIRRLPALLAALILGHVLPAEAATTVQVAARQPWVDTGVNVVAGETVSAQVTGEWSDFTIKTDADGYASPWNMKPLEWARRLPKARWFALVGCVGRDLHHCQVMSTGNQTLIMPITGRLYLFANDAPGFYWNNTGALTVAIGHHAPPPR